MSISAVGGYLKVSLADHANRYQGVYQTSLLQRGFEAGLAARGFKIITGPDNNYIVENADTIDAPVIVAHVQSLPSYKSYYEDPSLPPLQARQAHHAR